MGGGGGEQRIKGRERETDRQIRQTREVCVWGGGGENRESVAERGRQTGRLDRPERENQGQSEGDR